MIIKPPDERREQQLLRQIESEKPLDMSVCCREVYVTRLCFSELRPRFVVHWYDGTKSVVCEKCVEIYYGFVKMNPQCIDLIKEITID